LACSIGSSLCGCVCVCGGASAMPRAVSELTHPLTSRTYTPHRWAHMQIQLPIMVLFFIPMTAGRLIIVLVLMCKPRAVYHP